MIKPFVLVLLVAACFFAAVLNLAAESRLRKIIMSVAILCAVTVGAVYYGSGYAYCQGLSLASLMRALLALCRMFGGVNDLGAIADSPLLKTQTGLTVFWFGHFCAFYVTASAAIATLGDRLLRRIRVTLLRFGPLLVIYGVNASSVAYGKSMVKNKKRSVLFVDPDGNTSFESTIKAFGAVLEKSSEALSPDKKFMKHINIRPGSRKLELAALHTDGRRNLTYAKAFLAALTEAGIAPSQTSLIISGVPSEASSLQAQGNSAAASGQQANESGPAGTASSGYGSVLAFNDYSLTARLLLRDCPPAVRIRFDEHGKALEDFHAVILGYGQMGRAMLSALICNAQFSGSTFRADIFDPNPQNGFLHDHELLRRYDIHFHAAGGKSDAFYAFLSENRHKVRWISICTGSREENGEVARDLLSWYGPRARLPLIAQAVSGSYVCTDEGRQATVCENIFTSDTLDLSRIDAMAMQINHMYTGGASAEEDWTKCSYWGRLSSRASADFFPALLRASGKTADEVLAGEWPPEDETLENLAISEHKRWCAFHFVSGFSPLPEETFKQNAEAWLREVNETGSSRISLTKDMGNRLHACLIPWEELDALSARENEITGGHVDYKQMDRNNVIALSDVLKAARGK